MVYLEKSNTEDFTVCCLSSKETVGYGRNHMSKNMDQHTKQPTKQDTKYKVKSFLKALLISFAGMMLYVVIVLILMAA